MKLKCLFLLYCLSSLALHAQWKKQTLTGNKDLFDLHFQKGFLLIGGSNSALYTSTDTGKTLKTIGLSTPTNLRAVWAINQDTFLVTGENARILKTNDGGKTWSQKHVRTAAYAYDIKFQSMYGIAVGKDFMIISSSNYGESWTLDTTAPIGKSIHSVAIMPNGQCWAAADSGYLLHKHLTEKKWQLLKHPSVCNFKALQTFGDSVLLIVGSVVDTFQPNNIKNSIIKSTDNGKTFYEVSATEMRALLGMHFISPDSGYICGSNGLILKCNNPMDQAFRGLQLSNTASSYNAICVINGTGVAVGDGGLIARTNNYGGYGLQLDNNIDNPLAIFPNPNTGKFTLQAFQEHDAIHISNALGQAIPFEIDSNYVISLKAYKGLAIVQIVQGEKMTTIKIWVE
jgi:photosystem II stability/assembly factor-like uncharacterized protein